jgi:hypothetical protein
MSRKRVAVIALGMVSAAALSAFVAYRLGLRRSADTVRGVAVFPRKTGCVDFRQASLHTGENGCVTGRVLRVFTSRSGNTFLDFCQNYRQCPFSTVIFGSDRPRFGNLSALEGREIEIVGQIVTYGGHAEIVLHDPKQIRLAH